MAMLTTLLFATLFTPGQGQIRQDILLNKDGTLPRLMMRQPQDPLAPPKRGPKTFGENKIPFEFDWITWGFVRAGTGEEHELRLRVYSQERKPENDAAHSVTRMLLRLWDLNKQRLGIDQAPRQPDGYRLVNVYLTWGGQAGGEQFASADQGDGKTPLKVQVPDTADGTVAATLRSTQVKGEQFKGFDVENNRRVTANNIYIYDLASFTDPVEMAREVAHEYGHATLPAIGTYTAPEAWANGYLGEKLYLLWARDILAKDLLHPDDFMGAKKEQLDAWLAKNVDPLVLQAATKPPTMGDLAGKDAKSMDAFLGLVLYMSEILPDKVFARSLKLIGSQSARDYPSAISLAVEEPEQVQIRLPEALKGKEIWLPAGKARVNGAKILSIEGGWAKVVATEGITLTPRR
jgi:hypothetical protein